MANETNIPQTASKRTPDSSWVRQAFLTKASNLDATALRNRTFSTAAFKYSDTALGGSLEINPPPQFCRNADIRVPSILANPPTGNYNSLKPVASSAGPKGLGRYYSEALDDNKHVITMRFGVPRYNSLTTFFSHFYSPEAGTLARTGRSTGIFYTLGKVAGFLLPLTNLPLLLLTVGGALWNAVTGKPNSRYYSLKPTMPLYWNAVQSIVNNIAVNKGLVPRVMYDVAGSEVSGQYNFQPNDLAQYAALMPDVIMTDSADNSVGINVYAMATRYQRINRAVSLKMQAALASGQSDSGIVSTFADLKSTPFSGVRLDLSPGATNPSFQKYLAAYLSVSNNQPPTAGGGDLSGTVNPDGTPNMDAKPSVDVESYPTVTDNTFTEFVKAELDDGSQFVSFRVDESGPVGESFSSTARESDIASKINSLSSDARMTKFDFAGGNLVGGAIGDALGAIGGAIKDVVAGFGAGLGLSGLATFGGAAFVDIPQTWQDSTARLPSMNYSMTLVSPYGNKLSQLLNIYVPLAMILAAALPLSTGKQSYTSPFILELYDRGRSQTRLGIIDSLTIQRGVGNLGFDNAGNAMAIEVSFSILNLSSIMHMPISQGFSLSNPLASFTDQDSSFADYMAVLGSLTLDEQIYFFDKTRLALTRARQQMRTWFSRAHTAQWITSIQPLQLASMFFSGAVNR